mmetsp:Transcript_13173/g.20336  ORF Transcript_13173/g.20336 Transcript_13173/m.20336 type:complete len:81 (+) Transcript_13173:1407-1649(+)
MFFSANFASADLDQAADTVDETTTHEFSLMMETKLLQTDWHCASFTKTISTTSVVSSTKFSTVNSDDSDDVDLPAAWASS